MNFEELQEEDCTIYIEELKSDDPNLKINAVQKLQQISDILGPERTRDELIPYLVDIIEECDNDEEFLLKLSDELLELREKIGGSEYIVKLVEPLEILSSMEEQSIRQKSIDNLLQIVSGQPPTFFTSHFVNMVKQLAVWDNFPSRASASYFLPICYQKVSDQQQQQELVGLFRELAADDTPMVRRAVADNIGKFGKAVQKEVRVKEVLGVWTTLMKDRIDNVRIKAMENLQAIVGDLDQEQVKQVMGDSLCQVDPEKKSWRLRYALAELLPVVAQHLPKEEVKQQVVEVALGLLGDPDQEVKCIMLLQLPQLSQHLSKGVIQTSFLPLFQQLVTDISQYVRISLANILVKVGNHFENKEFIELIMPLIEKMFKDESLEVKTALITSFREVNVESKESQNKVIGLVEQITQEKNWRARLAMTKYLPELSKLLGQGVYQLKIEPIHKQLIMDHYYGIRQQIYLNYHALAQQPHPLPIHKELLNNITLQLSTNNYIFRIQAIKGLVAVQDLLDKTQLTEQFKKMFQQLRDDKIANVRFNLIQSFGHLQKRLSEAVKQEFLIWVRGRATDDQDTDVKVFASILLNQK